MSKNQIIDDMFYDFLISLPEIPDADSKSTINEFSGVVSQLFRRLPEEELRNAFPDILRGFSEVCKLTALYQHLEYMKKYCGDNNCGRDALRKHLSAEISLKNEEAAKQMLHLESLLPPAEEPSDPTYRKLKKILGGARLLTEEERKQRDEELKNMSSSELFRKFGLD